MGKKNIITNILLLSDKYGITEDDLCSAMQISRATFRRKKRSCGTFRLDEIERAAKRLHTTPEQLLGDPQRYINKEI